tara:strand:+ start:544 stop:1107 length:564 start_codon:yes stop_codon:yes gene_type:complete
MLHEYFPNATLYCCDINQQYINNAERFSPRIKPFYCDTSDKDILQQKMDELNIIFDIIIDDGSHKTKDQIVALDVLFKYVKNDGIYIVEDIHSSFNREDDESTIYYLKNRNSYKNQYISENGHKYFINNNKELIFYQRQTVPYRCFFCRKIIYNRNSTKCINCTNPETIFLPNIDESYTCLILKNNI